MSVAVGGSEMMIQGREKGVMKAWTMGEEWRVVREVSQDLDELAVYIHLHFNTRVAL
jgi:hypothetical protein